MGVSLRLRCPEEVTMEDAAELQKKVEEMVAKVATMQVAQQPLDVIRIRDAISSADIGHGVRVLQ